MSLSYWTDGSSWVDSSHGEGVGVGSGVAIAANEVADFLAKGASLDGPTPASESSLAAVVEQQLAGLIDAINNFAAWSSAQTMSSTAANQSAAAATPPLTIDLSAIDNVRIQVDLVPSASAFSSSAAVPVFSSASVALVPLDRHQTDNAGSNSVANAGVPGAGTPSPTLSNANVSSPAPLLQPIDIEIFVALSSKIALNNADTGMADLLGGSSTFQDAIGLINTGSGSFSEVPAASSADIETITLPTGTAVTFTEALVTYTAPVAASDEIGLTTGADTIVTPSSGATVYGTAATLNAGDSLTGGAGTDTLVLVGSGTFRVDQLASFSGFESIQVDNATNTYANLTLGSQPIEVDAIGYLSISVNSRSNWNSSDIITGDPSRPWSSTSLNFSNYQSYPPPAVTYDLTANTFNNHVSISAGGDNISLLINSLDTAGVQSFNAWGVNDRLVTAGSTLDLSHTTVSGFAVVSSNGLGTTFTVGDLGTAFQIAGGAGHDTIVAQGFTFTADQRAAIFATASVETIVDASGTYYATPLTVSVSIDNTNVNVADDTAMVTFAFSEAPTSFTLADTSAVGGTLNNLRQANATTYTATFTGAANTDISNASVSVTAGSWQDSNGNLGAGGSTASFTVDTLTFQSLGVLPGSNPAPNAPQATALSADGSVVVGYSREEAFSWSQPTGMVGLGFLNPTLGYTSSYATGVSGDGSVVAGYSLNGSGNTEAFIWTKAEGMVSLGFLPGGVYSDAFAISSNATVIVGVSNITGSNSSLGQAFRWEQSTGMLGLGFLPGDNYSGAFSVSSDGSVVVGNSGVNSGNFFTSQAFCWTEPVGMIGLGYLTGATDSFATGVSSDGSVVVGSSGSTPYNFEAFRWNQGTGMVGLGFLTGDIDSFAYGTNADGTVVVGYCQDASYNLDAFRWTAALGMQSIKSILEGEGDNLAGWTLYSGNAVSADGTTIVGYGLHGGTYEPWIAHIPTNAFSLLDLQGVDHSIGSLVWGGTVTNSGASPATLTVGSDNTDTTFNGSIQDGNSATALTKIGTGTLTLSGKENYTGGTVIAAGTLELGSGASILGDVTFAGITGTLKLDNSSSFTGTVAGMFGQDTIDFADINPATVGQPSYSGNSSGGTLTVTDGSHTANIALLGNYLASTFVPSSDGHGGTSVIDPPAAGSNQTAHLTQPH
jgi:autotransporter-associated beta strand protein/probable HAF family extracellular repeat protein